MSAGRIHLPFGREELSFACPPGWNVLAVAEPAAGEKIEQPELACAAALAQPLDSEPLRVLARDKRRVIVVVDDISRPTPVAQFIGPVLTQLTDAGVPDEAIVILFAQGVHRAMTAEEAAVKLGPAIAARYRWLNHDSLPGAHLAPLGKTTRRTEVWVNRLVAEADLIVGLGAIEPHIIASFGGGVKLLVPGVAGRKTIAQNHALNTRPETFNSVGLDPARNPMRADLEEAATMIKAPMFFVNAVLRPDLTFARLLAGNPFSVYRHGAAVVAQLYGAPVPGRADVVLTCSHPMNHDFRQSAKAVTNTVRALKKGGTLLCFAVCEQGLGDVTVREKPVRFGKRGMRMLARFLLPLVGRFRFGMQEDDHFITYFTLQTIKNYNVIFYAPNIPREFTEKMKFLEIHHDLDRALAAAVAAAPRADVLVFPHGGVTYPVFPA